VFHGTGARRLYAAFFAVTLASCSGGSLSSPVPRAPVPTQRHVAVPATSIHHAPRGAMPAGVQQPVLAQVAAAQLAQDASRRNLGMARVRALSRKCQTGGSPHLAVHGLGGASLLVLYDTAGTWGYLGELYAMGVANLGGHFANVYTEPISAYSAGQIKQYSAIVYVGSTYYSAGADGIPASFYTDVASSATPVVWMNDNIWNFANAMGAAAFKAKYGWDPTSSYFAPSGTVGNISQVQYRNATLVRQFPAGTDGGVLHPSIANPSAVTVLAQALDTSTNPATAFPYAIRSGNLTYVGEIPFEYVVEKDRLIVLEDLLFDALAPSTPTRHRAMVRLEDISAADNPNQVLAVAQDLAARGIPYGFNVIPFYRDPLGYYNNGVPQEIPLWQAQKLLGVIQYMQSHGGTLIDEGFTHQYDNVVNPYTGASGDDAEFFRAHVDGNNSVVWDGPAPEDSALWAFARVAGAAGMFGAVGLHPRIWVTPHYYASATDYRVIAAVYPVRYERAIYFNGLLAGGQINSASYIGEFFPYVVNDVYGSRVLPENLGDYEPVPLNNNPARLPADIVSEAQANLAIRDGFASFFYDPSYGTGPLDQTLTGIQNLGYTFVSPSTQ